MKKNCLRGMIGTAAVAVIAISVMACGDDEEWTSRPSGSTSPSTGSASTPRVSSGVTADRDHDYVVSIANATDVFLNANTVATAALAYARDTRDLDGLDDVILIASNAADSLRRIQPTGASRCIRDVDAMFDRAMDTYIMALSQIATGIRLDDAALLVDASDNMDRAISQILSAADKMLECTSQ